MEFIHIFQKFLIDAHQSVFFFKYTRYTCLTHVLYMFFDEFLDKNALHVFYICFLMNFLD